MSKRWYGSPPVACDLCGDSLAEEFFDSRTRRGPWGNICRPCWRAENGRLGVGVAQRYMKLDDAAGGDWVKVEEMPS
jgi:hypothetical protein